MITFQGNGNLVMFFSSLYLTYLSLFIQSVSPSHSIFKIVFISSFIHWGGGACSGVPVEVRGQIAGIGSLLPSCGSRELNSAYQVWLQAQLPIKPSPCFEKINNEYSFLLSILFLIFKRIKIKTTSKNVITKRITYYTRN